MDGLEEKINKILSDPKALGSVMEMAKAFAGSNLQKEDEEDIIPDETAEKALAPASAASAVDTSGLMNLISGMDPKMIGTLMSLVGELNKKDDRRVNLLMALKPYVRAERHEKIERAAQLVKMARTAQKAFGAFGGKRDV